MQEYRNNPISDEILKKKPEDFAKQFCIENINLSIGTLSRFKERRGFMSFKVVGKMAENNFDSLEFSIEEITAILNDYDKKIFLIWMNKDCFFV